MKTSSKKMDLLLTEETLKLEESFLGRKEVSNFAESIGGIYVGINT